MANTSKKVKGMKKRADRLARQVVLERDKTCWRCGGPANTWAHIIRRKAVNILWDTSNARAMCASCHYSITNAREGEAWHWINYIGDEAYDRLVALGHADHPSGFSASTVARMEWVLADLEGQLEMTRDPFSWTNP